MAVLERDGFISRTWSFRCFAAAWQSLTPDKTRPKDRNILEAFPPDEAVVPMVVAEVLISIPCSLWLGGVIAGAGRDTAFRHRSGKDGRALFQINCHIALKPDGITRERPGRHTDRTATGTICRLNRAIDG